MQEIPTITNTSMFDDEISVRERIAKCPLNLYIDTTSVTSNKSEDPNADHRHIQE